MKKIYAIFTAVLVVAMVATTSMFVSCGGKNDAPKKDTSSEDSLNRILNQKDAEISNLLGTVNDIQKGLAQITEAEGQIAELRAGGEASSADQIRQYMAFIQQTMDTNRQRINDLQQQLQNSNINADELRNTIESLQQQIDNKDAQIKKLFRELASRDIKIQEQSTQITSLNTDKENLTKEKESLTQDKENLTQDKIALSQANEAKANTIAQQDNALHKGWYVFGTKKELKEQSILNGKEVLSQGFNKNYLTEVDIRNLKTIPLGSKSAKLLTSHPAGSYTLDRDPYTKYYTLRITNYTQFWSVSKYLVILVN